MLQFKVLLTISNPVHTDPYLIVLPTVFNVFYFFVCVISFNIRFKV